MAVYNKGNVEKKAKELEAGINIKGASKSLVRYVARCKAIDELYPDDKAAATDEMIKKNYRVTAPASKSWLEQLKANGFEVYATAMERNFAPPAAPEAKPAAPAQTAAVTPAAPPPSNTPPVPPQPSAAAASLDDLLKQTP